MIPKNFGNWRFEGNLGAGAFGRVELWKNSYTNKKIAIKKCMLPKNNITPRQIERWKQEIDNMKNFNHPNIVKSEAIPPEMMFDSPVLCMEFCNRGDLRKFLNEPENSCGLIQKDALTVMKDISSALKYLHYHNITHRDLKPENIVLHMCNENIIYKLIDLGYAKELGNQTTTASFVGTFNYVAPELLYKKKYTCSVDYWSLGILFFEVWTGYKPFIPYNENLRNWIRNMEAKKYEDICAREVDCGIKFFDHIIHPNDMSESILSMMIDWFQVVLQWDRRRRGKRRDCDNIVVFPLLRDIFPHKTINVFSVAAYRNDVYHVKGRTTFGELQKWIEQRTNIPCHEQLITDTSGYIFNRSKNPDKLLSECESDSTLYVYHGDSLEVTSSDDDSKLPEILDLMLVKPNEIKDGSLLRQCYTALIFIMRREMASFRNYVLALATRFDIISERFRLLSNDIAQNLPQAEMLLHNISSSLDATNHRIDLVECMKALHGKVETLYTTMSRIKIEIDHVGTSQDRFKEYFTSEIFSQSQQKYYENYENLLNKFSKFESEKTCTFDCISQHIAALSETFALLEDQRIAMLQDSEIAKMAKQLENFGKFVHSHSEVIKSSMRLIPSYNAQYSELLSQMNQNIHFAMNSDVAICSAEMPDSNVIQGVNDDVEIMNNIFLRTALDSYLQDLRRDFQSLSMDLDEWELPR